MRMAKLSPSWGYDRIQGAMANLGHKIAPNTVKRLLKEHGIEPAPLRRLPAFRVVSTQQAARRGEQRLLIS